MQFIHRKNKVSGLVVPLLALKKSEHAACGTFPDLVSLGKIAQQWGLSLIQLLPLNDTGNGTSPYAALSVFALHPIYISLLDAIDTVASMGVPFEDEVATELERAERSLNRKYGDALRVPFEQVLHAKLAALRAAWEASKEIFKLIRRGFAAQHEWAKPYACFVALKEKFGLAPWWDWPAYRNINAEAIESLWMSPEFAEQARFRLWLQVLAHDQLGKAAHEVYAHGVDIMGDIPILLAKIPLRSGFIAIYSF